MPQGVCDAGDDGNGAGDDLLEHPPRPVHHHLPHHTHRGYAGTAYYLDITDTCGSSDEAWCEHTAPPCYM